MTEPSLIPKRVPTKPTRRTAGPDFTPADHLSASAAQQAVVGLLAVIATVLMLWALKWSAVVTMPLAFAFFVAILVHPVERSLAGWLPAKLEWIGVAGAMLALLATMLVALALVSFALEPVLARAPQYADELAAHWQTLRTWAGGHGLALPRDLDPRKWLGGNGFQPLVFGLSSAWQVLAFLLLVFFFTLLMLLEASAWRRKAFVALPAQGAAAIAIVPALARKVRRFLLVRTALGMISAFLAAAWLWLMGIDFAPFWGVLFFLLNYLPNIYLPNIGSIIAGVPPILLAFVQFDFGWALMVAAGLLAMEQAMGNFVDPRLQGRTLNISSLVVLLSVILWGWIWAIPGALIAVPLTLTIVVVCAHIPTLRPIAVLLSGGTDIHAAEELRD
jgi:AI-2 transport protein TqsA